ncbi:MAG: GC-type dockerin domain-anchored protein, partial [Phycisphaerales bacterium]
GNSVTGTFDTFVPPPVTSNIRWRLFYTPTTVELRATCLADIDGDCELTIFDFLEFQNLFSLGSPEADFDGDGLLTIFDFLTYQNAFAAGCS